MAALTAKVGKEELSDAQKNPIYSSRPLQRIPASEDSRRSNSASHRRQNADAAARDRSGREDDGSGSTAHSGDASNSDARSHEDQTDHVDQGSSLYNRKVANTAQDIDSSKAAPLERRTEEKKPDIIKTPETSEVSIRLIFFCFLISFLYFTLPLYVFIFVILIVSSLLLYVKRTNESSA